MKACLILGFTLLSCASYAQNQNEFYARLNLDAQMSEEGDGQFSEIQSNNSWIGVKGDWSLEQDWTLFYRLEWKVDVTAEDGVDTFTPRPQYVGIRGEFGEVLIGRNYTAVWMTQGKIDLFNHYEGDIKGLFKGENLLTDVVAYTSPKWQNLTMTVTYQAEKSATGKDATSVAVFYGDQNLKSTSVFASVGHDFDVKGYDVTRATLQTKIHDNGKLGVMLQRQQPAVGGQSKNGYLLSYAHKFSQWQLNSQYQRIKDDTAMTVGVDYPLSKTTKLFGWFTRFNMQDNPDRHYLAIGIEHKLSVAF